MFKCIRTEGQPAPQYPTSISFARMTNVRTVDIRMSMYVRRLRGNLKVEVDRATRAIRNSRRQSSRSQRDVSLRGFSGVSGRWHETRAKQD